MPAIGASTTGGVTSWVPSFNVTSYVPTRIFIAVRRSRPWQLKTRLSVMVPRKLVAVFHTPTSEFMLRLAVELGFHSVLVEPDPSVVPPATRPHGDRVVGDLGAAGLDEHTDLVVTDHHRPEIGDILKQALAAETRWI